MIFLVMNIRKTIKKIGRYLQTLQEIFTNITRNVYKQYKKCLQTFQEMFTNINVIQEEEAFLTYEAFSSIGSKICCLGMF